MSAEGRESGMLESSGSPEFRRAFRVLIILVASYLPVAGVVGVIGWMMAHSLVPLMVAAGLYVVAIAVVGLKAWRARGTHA
jgi:cell division septal protein FtsQ